MSLYKNKQSIKIDQQQQHGRLSGWTKPDTYNNFINCMKRGSYN